MNRTTSIDLLRGFIMMLMAIDHASGMIARVHFTEIWGLDFVGYGTLGWWFTRFVSHLCAPGFFFLMGVSICLFAEKRLQKSWDNRAIQQYFLKRGAFILVSMFLIEFPAWGLSAALSQVVSEGSMMPLPGYFTGGFFIPSTVLFGLGACMMIGSFLWRIGKVWLILMTVASFAFSTWYIHQLSPNDVLNPFLVLLCTPGISVGAMVIYPIIPWLGVMTFGMFWAKLYLAEKEQIYTISLWTGLAFVAAFLVLRFLEVGNFQLNAYEDWISFFSLIKYPPSITFILITCGINLILLFIFSKLVAFAWLRPLRLFGQTAMFFYLTHLYVYALLGAFFPLGASMEVMYLCWAIGLIPLYFMCQWFLGFKKNKPVHSLWRMI